MIEWMKFREDWLFQIVKQSYLFIRDKWRLLRGAISLNFIVKQSHLSIFCGVKSAISISCSIRWKIAISVYWTNFWPYLILARYLNPISRDLLVANLVSRRYLNPESRDNFRANSVSRGQKRSYPASHETPSGAPLKYVEYSVR